MFGIHTEKMVPDERLKGNDSTDRGLSMSNKKGGAVWLWVFLAIGAAAAVGYGWYQYAKPQPEEEVTVELTVTEEGAPGAAAKRDHGGDQSEKRENVLDTAENVQKEALVPSGQTTDQPTGEEDAVLKPQPTGKMVAYEFKSGEKKPQPPTAADQEGAEAQKARYCNLIDQYVQDFFQYLDTKKYIQNLKLGETSFNRFKKVMERLVSKPPIPAGEGVDPAIMVKNIYFFCRALDKKDLFLIKQVVSHDRDTLEDNMGMFYQWLMLGEGCPDPGNVRPSFEVLYRYAGFFLNTTGGRAYMFRRGLKVRLLVSYYSVLIIYQADKAGKNNYGIDVLPHIRVLMEEMSNYPDLQYKEGYLETLAKIKGFYSGRR
jgi:hypothetical protein